MLSVRDSTAFVKPGAHVNGALAPPSDTPPKRVGAAGAGAIKGVPAAAAVLGGPKLKPDAPNAGGCTATALAAGTAGAGAAVALPPAPTFAESSSMTDAYRGRSSMAASAMRSRA